MNSTTSVIIPSYNGKNKVINLLHALEKQTVTNFEVIVVIDGSTDGTADFLKQKKFSFSSFRIIEQNNQGRARVRNNGAYQANGKLLIFFDDDMRPEPHCIEAHLKHHQEIHKSIVTGGILEDRRICKSDIQRYRAWLSETWSAAYLHNDKIPMKKDKLFLSAANFSIEKETFLKLGSFCQELTDTEDFELAMRAFKSEVPLYYRHSALAWHDDGVTCASYIRRQRQYIASNHKLQDLKPELYKEFKGEILNIKPTGIRKIIFTLLAHVFWINLVDHFNLFILLPKRLRYRLYDAIIMANGIHYPDRVKL